MDCIIYSISHPETKDVVYIGQSSSFDSRKIAHLNYSKNPSVNSFMLKLKLDGLAPVFSEIEKCEREISNERERFWIKHFSENFKLFNCLQGRPKKEKDPLSKQMNVMVPGYLIENDTFNERIKFQSFSQFVLGLIRQEVGL